MKINAAETPLFNAGLAIVKKIRQNGGNAYFVGGFVRNLLLGKACKDIDIASTMIPSDMLKIFPGAQSAGASFGVLIVKSEGFHFEVATAREERLYMDGRHPEKVQYTKDFKTDSERRDFTVNAMFYDPENMEIIDFHNGINDLQKGILRTVGDSTRRFQEDYLRMLRAIRFSAAYDLKIAPETWQSIKENAHLCLKIAPERIRQELDLMFSSKNAFKAFELLDRSSILQILLPEVHILHTVEQPANFHPEGDVFKHTLLMLKRMAYPSADLAWSIILHDIGKKPCFFRDHKGIHFFGHEAKGAVMAEEILTRLSFSNNRKKLISTLVKDHMRFVQVKNMRLATLRKLLAREDLKLLMELNRLDSVCSCNLMEDWLFMLDSLAKYQNQEILPTPAIGGSDLLKMGIKPGPDFKKILNFLYEMQLSGKKIDFSTACDLIKKHFPCILRNR
ncbi:MAG: CCA tRNA nucleotidyltransferase [Lentisphaeria bacterium]|nr:CCA tRNA nucleotidyltransferase [Lentisphaeria bacterium]